VIKFTITSTKGGVGKATHCANLGALLADLGLRVVLIDADVQPSLSKYFPLAAAKPSAGLTEVVTRGEVTVSCITGIKHITSHSSRRQNRAAEFHVECPLPETVSVRLGSICDPRSTGLSRTW
jgi:chromosome partitioning related protein ParA